MSCQEARVFRFKAEEAERQLALLRSEASARNERLAADHAKALRQAERKGKSNYAAMVGAPASQFKAEYQQLKEAQELVGDFRECRGSIGRIQELWDPIPVSPDTEEAATDFAGEGGEVDQPESTFGASMSENFETGLIGFTAGPRFSLGLRLCDD
ncbi:hypothetical protein F2Q69_00012162 [Brassica cretica]|uniref:Uncharacterized protein n=1 Tax=Brassica cretica TaxID=69181 RepID=A0A8S9R0T5_BRACR|nr:hypothetical protein F2Q69_00012162 [Brassica cretica]